MEVLKKLREERELKQQQVADFLNIHQVSYSQYENGKREPDITTLKKLASFFDVSIDYLLGYRSNNEIKSNVVIMREFDKLKETITERITIIEKMLVIDNSTTTNNNQKTIIKGGNGTLVNNGNMEIGVIHNIDTENDNKKRGK